MSPDDPSTGRRLSHDSPALDSTSAYNRKAWDHLVAIGNRWTRPVDRETIKKARLGTAEIVLTGTRSVPAAWLPDLDACEVLCLAGSGGQQAPILAAAGARVTVLDNSRAQLTRDIEVADREGLRLTTCLGDMRELGVFAESSFDLIVHPCSNAFVPDIEPVWRGCARVLRPGGELLSGFLQAWRYVFDEAEVEQGRLVVRHALPYSDESHLRDDELDQLRKSGEPFVFSHGLRELIGGQLQVGLQLVDLYEDGQEDDPVSTYAPIYLATRCRKPV